MPKLTVAPEITVAEPDVVGPLAVFPLFGPSAALPFVSFAEASALGAALHEVDGQASVNDLLAINPLDVPVFFYEGEEVRGAQQDRTLDVSVLVPAHSRTRVPVSCVEHGRWDGSRHAEPFWPAPASAYPSLRRLKNEAAHLSGRASQDEVWDEVADKSDRLGAVGDTGALRDAFAARRDELDASARAVTRRDGQLGAVACVAGKVAVLDWVGRADVFAALHGPLVEGYALDAIEHVTDERPPAPPSIADVDAFIASVLGAPRRRRPAVGLGEDVRFASRAASGAALEVDGALVALTAFPGEQAKAQMSRPSRRSR